MPAAAAEEAKLAAWPSEPFFWGASGVATLVITEKRRAGEGPRAAAAARCGEGRQRCTRAGTARLSCAARASMVPLLLDAAARAGEALILGPGPLLQLLPVCVKP